VVIQKLLCLFGSRARGLQLLMSAVERDLLFLQRGYVGFGYVVAPLGNRGLDFCIVFLDLSFESDDFLLEKLLGGHYLDDVVLHLRDLLAHVADGLLENQLGVFGLLDYPTEYGTEQPLESTPHPLLLKWPRVRAGPDSNASFLCAHRAAR